METNYPSLTPHNESQSIPLMSSAARYPSSQTTPSPASSLMSRAARQTGSVLSSTRAELATVQDVEVTDVQRIRDVMDSTEIESQVVNQKLSKALYIYIFNQGKMK